ncbi:MAG: PhzF family phenazine biosynthesis protein [Candidatus Dormibacteraeota bacterium]|uniref:PhzF family phenazine biosynthesis protein n=1 Tax=Candidatus Dormiibacter inghamiae TaxID=3127013 RepID=A0A934N6A5_9BACT|nr:PhzF family phenazine biosynthesis protein [Candidatus Dormibacteraeota bacterium]MBJ7604893.1 PhzF family phenazine biosynthesis protein [Candidatus Dormibacteraeota bacterium]
MSYKIRTFDVFTRRRLEGNGLAVVLDAEGMSPETMQAIAREMNLSETVFVLPPVSPGSVARAKIFTPSTELPFAGHPTIGTAWALWSEGRLDGVERFSLDEEVGPVKLRQSAAEGGGPMFWLTCPPILFGHVIDDRARVAAAVHLAESDLVPSVPIQLVDSGGLKLYVALRDPETVDRAVSDAHLLAALGEHLAVPVYIFAAAAAKRLYGRMFGPAVGVSEDPATGSAAGPLACFAVRHGIVQRADSVALLIEQGTKMGRRSLLHVELTYERVADAPSLVEVGGEVAAVLSGELSID